MHWLSVAFRVFNIVARSLSAHCWAAEEHSRKGNGNRRVASEYKIFLCFNEASGIYFFFSFIVISYLTGYKWVNQTTVEWRAVICPSLKWFLVRSLIFRSHNTGKGQRVGKPYEVKPTEIPSRCGFTVKLNIKPVWKTGSVPACKQQILINMSAIHSRVTSLCLCLKWYNGDMHCNWGVIEV